MDIPEDNLAFAPVITSNRMNIHKLMHTVRNGKETGFTFIESDKITNIDCILDDIYFIYNVNLGDMIGKSPKEARELIKEHGRLCLTVDESIAACIYSNVLSDYYIDCSGSYFAPTGLGFTIILGDLKPIFTWRDSNTPHNDRGSGSCQCRI